MCVLFNSSLDYLLGSHPSPSLVVIINNDFFEIVFRVILGLLWEYLGIKSLLSKRPIFKCNYQYIIADGLCNWGEYALALVGITRRDEVDGKVHLFNVNLTNDTVPEHIQMVVMLVIAA